jgi:4'-phosphopantetheinyl transferase
MHQVPMITSTTVWQPATKTLHSRPDQIHLCQVHLDLITPAAQAISCVLSADEKARAERFRSSKDRERYIITRAYLRFLLSRYLDIAPAQLRFTYNAHGKPQLVDEPNSPRLRFSLSHSDGFALYAVTQGRNIGVDVERVCGTFDYREIACRFFDEEPSNSQSISSEDFYRRWTRNEALAKALGRGVDQFSRAREKEAGYALVDLTPEPGFVAALAVEGGEGSFTVEWLKDELGT